MACSEAVLRFAGNMGEQKANVVNNSSCNFTITILFLMSFDKPDCKSCKPSTQKMALHSWISSHPIFCLVEDVAVPGSDWWRAKMSQVTMSPHPLPKSNSRSAVSKHGSNTNQVPKHLLLPPQKKNSDKCLLKFRETYHNESFQSHTWV